MKTWFITGTASGIGHEVVKQLLERGDKVAATSRTPQKLIEDFGPKSERFLPIEMDLLSQESVNNAVSNAISYFGHIDVLINNAGYGHNGTFEETSEELFRKNFEINVYGPMKVARAMIPHFRERRSGIIFNISSAAAFHVSYARSTYAASKHALTAITETLRIELASFGIRVSSINPGPFSTKFFEQKSMQDIPIDDYKEMDEASNKLGMEWKWEDVDKGAALIIDAADWEEIPANIFLGKVALDVVRHDLQAILDDMDKFGEKCSHCGSELK